MPNEPLDRKEFVVYFRDEAQELLRQIEVDLLRLERSLTGEAADSETINSLFRALHTIKGNAAMLGFGSLSDVAHRLESLCDLLRNERMALSESSLDLLFAGSDLLTDLVAAAVDDMEEPPGVFEFLARLESFAAVYQETASLIEGTAGPERPFDEAASEGTAGADATQIAAFEAEVERLLAQAQEAQPQPVASETPQPQTTSQGRGVPARTYQQTIRVDIDRLDTLLNLIGELVISRTRISDAALTLERLFPDHASAGGELGALAKTLAENVGLLARTTNEIQASIMKVRMVPIGRVFERFPRLVRDVAKARHKEARLEVAGAETELDKTIVDEIGEPLMHLMRNCIDHGIEVPEQREAAGKPRVGTVSLNAYHEGNQIIIEISDDGAGIDLQRVRERARKLGLIAPEEHPADEETVELIFTPGFSTAEAVSDVSGRGVGMDVVKKNITRLKGVFEVHTERGRGTRFTIKLPLTLAIIQALLIRVNQKLFAIPLDSVIESQRVEISDVRTVQGNEVAILRGQIVPLVRIAELFELGGRRDPEKAMVVVVGLQGGQVGLVVDAFEGEQEIVIKPLSDVVGHISGISGATILGNGSISLIIDVHSLVTDAYATGKVARAEFSGV